MPATFLEGRGELPRIRMTQLIWTESDLNSYDAILGDFHGGDGVRFNLVHYPTCQRRGPYRLIIEIEDFTATWGCFDEQDQPMRYYHSEERAKAEAQAIADVLVAEHEKKAASR